MKTGTDKAPAPTRDSNTGPSVTQQCWPLSHRVCVNAHVIAQIKVPNAKNKFLCVKAKELKKLNTWWDLIWMKTNLGKKDLRIWQLCHWGWHLVSEYLEIIDLDEEMIRLWFFLYCSEISRTEWSSWADSRGESNFSLDMTELCVRPRSWRVNRKQQATITY